MSDGGRWWLLLASRCVDRIAERGLVTSEQLPEKGASGNGSVTYPSYDPRGHVGSIVDGPNNRSYTYDRAERLTNARITSGSALIPDCRLPTRLRLPRRSRFGSPTAWGCRHRCLGTRGACSESIPTPGRTCIGGRSRTCLGHSQVVQAARHLPHGQASHSHALSQLPHSIPT
jgi:YD repeat-containing protein